MITASAASASANAATLSAYAAYAAAGVAALLAAIQAYVGHRQSKAALISARAALLNAENAGRHRIAAFRQNWINSVIETLTTYQSIEATRDPSLDMRPDDARQMSALRAKLEIFLNPNEPDTVELLEKMDKMKASTDRNVRAAHEADIVRVARQLLKREWARIKNELS